MRFIFKTDYGQDIKLAKHGGQVFWYGALLLLLLAAPGCSPNTGWPSSPSCSSIPSSAWG
jgi:hypothetical protein